MSCPSSPTHAEDIPPRGAAAAVAVRGRLEGRVIKPPNSKGGPKYIKRRKTTREIGKFTKVTMLGIN